MQEKDINQSTIRGIAAFLILFTHIIEFTKPSCILRAFMDYGYLWVGIFFFYTGYNFLCSYQNNSNFFKNFWRKKIIRIYIPLILSNILFLIIKTNLYNITYNNLDIIKNIFGIICINDINWYIYAVLIFYLCGWTILELLNKFKNMKTRKIALLISSFIIFSLYSITYYHIAMQLHLTTSIRNVYPLTLLFGMIYAIYKHKILKIIENKTLCEISIISLSLASITFHYANINKLDFFIFNVEVIDYLVPIFFTLLVIIISSKVKLDSKIFDFIDSISLEMYIFHYVVLCLFSNPTFSFANNYIYLTIYTIVVIIISYVVHNLVKIFLNKYKRSENDKLIKKIAAI